MKFVEQSCSCTRCCRHTLICRFRECAARRWRANTHLFRGRRPGASRSSHGSQEVIGVAILSKAAAAAAVAVAERHDVKQSSKRNAVSMCNITAEQAADLDVIYDSHISPPPPNTPKIVFLYIYIYIYIYNINRMASNLTGIRSSTLLTKFFSHHHPRQPREQGAPFFAITP